MTSKFYFKVVIIFIILYIVTSIGVIWGIPDWVHQVCSIAFVFATFLGLRQKKKERKNNT